MSFSPWAALLCSHFLVVWQIASRKETENFLAETLSSYTRHIGPHSRRLQLSTLTNIQNILVSKVLKLEIPKGAYLNCHLNCQRYCCRCCWALTNSFHQSDDIAPTSHCATTKVFYFVFSYFVPSFFFAFALLFLHFLSLIHLFAFIIFIFPRHKTRHQWAVNFNCKCFIKVGEILRNAVREAEESCGNL